jgi:hypothetical protein
LFGIGRFFSADITLRLGKLPSEQERNDDKAQSKDEQSGGFGQYSDLAHLQSCLEAETVLVMLTPLAMAPIGA